MGISSLRAKSGCVATRKPCHQLSRVPKSCRMGTHRLNVEAGLTSPAPSMQVAEPLCKWGLKTGDLMWDELHLSHF